MSVCAKQQHPERLGPPVDYTGTFTALAFNQLQRENVSQGPSAAKILMEYITISLRKYDYLLKTSY
jgi:hypothetical protein